MIVNIGNSQQKWHDLLLLLRNSTSTSFRLEFPDSTAAKNAVVRFLHQIEKYPSWFPMVITRRGSNVYIVKTAFVRKVVVKDEPDKDDE